MIVASDLDWLWWTLPAYAVTAVVLVAAVVLFRRGRLR